MEAEAGGTSDAWGAGLDENGRFGVGGNGLIVGAAGIEPGRLHARADTINR
jgi:hypothetical protein